MAGATPKTPRRAYRVAITLHPEREADLHAWAKAVPDGELAAHLKQALREYIARYAGQTVTVPVALRRLQVPAVPGMAAGPVATVTGGDGIPTVGASAGASPAARPPAPPIATAPTGPDETETAIAADTLAAMRALNAQFGG